MDSATVEVDGHRATWSLDSHGEYGHDLHEALVIDPIPTTRLGICRALESHGFSVAEPKRPSAWLRIRQHARVGIFAVREDNDLDGLQELAYGQNSVVAVVDSRLSSSNELCAIAINAGAKAALPADTRASTLVAAAQLVLSGVSVLPSPILRRVTPGYLLLPADLSSEERTWLQGLADGVEIAEIACSAGYSERTMYRKLSKLYRRLGVRNRVAAVRLAHQASVIPSRCCSCNGSSEQK